MGGEKPLKRMSAKGPAEGVPRPSALKTSKSGKLDVVKNHLKAAKQKIE